MKRFVELEYTGKIKDGEVFDTTIEKVAKENNIFGNKAEYKPITICIGEGHIIKGLDKELEGKKAGKYTFEIPAEDGFGKRDAKLIQLIPTQKIKQNNIRPFPGLQLNIDGTIATIKSVSGGRCMVDFNHPLAGKDLIYEVEVLKDVEDDVEKVKALLAIEAQIAPKVEEKDGNIVIHGKIPESVQEIISKRISEFIEKKITFEDNKSS
ncbi:peptidylprolyl isomerase [Candidatus Woesearchaeota archaeon]|nr:peptidylprolyl isomerase [Candidatus Woesearchaeota archaeon]